MNMYVCEYVCVAQMLLQGEDGLHVCLRMLTIRFKKKKTVVCCAQAHLSLIGKYDLINE